MTFYVSGVTFYVSGVTFYVSGVTFYSVQVGDAAKRQAVGRLPALVDWTAELRDFADTAALVSALDLVIAVDTSTGHVAGAVGKETWLMVPFLLDWRWLVGREDTPWYPATTLFRQSSPGDWAGVVARVAEALAARARGNR